MIGKKIFNKWKNGDEESGLFAVYIGFDVSKKEHYLKQKYFDLANQIPDKKRNANILTNILKTFIGFEFIAKLQTNKFSWYPEWMKTDSIDSIYIEKYLDRCTYDGKKTKNYLGDIVIDDIEEFLEIFLDYPMNYEYQDIEIYSLKSNFVINISNHGTVWIISDNENNINTIVQALSSENLIVMMRELIL